MNPPKTRHGPYFYPDEMRHAVFSATKRMAAALAMFYVAERYGEEIFDEEVADYVPAFAGRPEWKGVTYSHALNVATGTWGGEDYDVFTVPLLFAPDQEAAINNIAQLGDAEGAPGEVSHYAATHTFVLSYALQKYVEEKEDEGVRH